jgi:hypothetical protein
MIWRILACIAMAVIGTTAIVGFSVWSQSVIYISADLERELTPAEITFLNFSILWTKYIYIPIAVLVFVCLGLALHRPQHEDRS